MNAKRMMRSRLGLDASRSLTESPDQPELPVWPKSVTGGKYVRTLDAHVRKRRTAIGRRAIGAPNIFHATKQPTKLNKEFTRQPANLRLTA